MILDLEIWVRGHPRSSKLIPFESLGVVSYSPSIVSMALCCINSEIKPDIGTFLHLTPPLGGGVSVGILPSRLGWKN